jgi:hypothetical protein
MMRHVGLILIFIITFANAGIFSSRRGVVFETKGEADILRVTGFGSSVERRDIPIPKTIDLRQPSEFDGVSHDQEDGWTRCRVKLKGDFGLTGSIERSLVFKCKPLMYFDR